MHRQVMRVGRRILIAVVGGIVIAAGAILAMPLVPGPGIPLVLLGLGMLSLEFQWPRRWLAGIKAKGVQLKQRLGPTRYAVSMLVLKAIGLWLLILGCAFLNGTLREALLVPKFGNPVALVLSGVLLSVCILAVSLALVPRLGDLKVSHRLYMGLFWVLLTLMFEIGFGRFLRHQSWSALLDAYTFGNGNIWPLVLVVTCIAPLVATKPRARIDEQQNSRKSARGR